MARPRRPLITERDVRRAAKAGQRSLDAHGASVTPSALDAARQLGVALQGTTKAPLRQIAPSAAAKPPAAQNTSVAQAQRVALGADHGGVSMKDAVLAALREKGHTVQDLGTFGPEAVDYPDFALMVAKAVAEGRADLGIMIDGAGIGSCMVANKVRGVRAAMCHDITTATNAREHNNANVLTLGGTLIGNRLAVDIVDAFLRTAFAGGRHQRRVDKIDGLDESERLVGGG
ncbi:MAG: ribose 5-phosphate isomerase B [Gemmatimonadaceae bacterium]